MASPRAPTGRHEPSAPRRGAWRRARRFVLELVGKDSHLAEVRGAVSRVADRLIRASLAPADQVVAQLGASPAGLTEEEARARLERFGRNEVAHETAPAWYRQLLMAFANPFVGILAVLAIASWLTEYVFAPVGERDLTSVGIIALLIAVSVVLAFVQEYRANQAADRLRSQIQAHATVQRAAGRVRLPTSEIVPGDVVVLSAGDVIPADVRLLSVTALSVNEAALTGESLPVEKRVEAWEGEAPRDLEAQLETASALDLRNVGYMGTDVVSGAARAVVLATGRETYFGSMSRELVGHHPPTSFDQGVRAVSLLLIRFMLVMVPIIFLISGVVRGDWFQALLFGLAVAVGLTPEMLPTIVTANLAKGTVEMARRKTIVKRLSAIQNLGAMDVLCTDKTGTLTYDSVALRRYVNLRGETDAEVLRLTYLNAVHQEGLRNPLDEAVIAYWQAEVPTDVAGFRKVAEIPFATARRRLSVVLEDDRGERVLVCKGAVDEMLAASSRVAAGGADGGATVALSAEARGEVARLAGELVEDGLRVLAVGYRGIDAGRHAYGVDDERDLILAGLVGFLDPPKDTAGPALVALRSRGVRVCVITGDNEIATRRVCREIGFDVEGLLQGHEIERLTDDALAEAVVDHNVFVRTAPLEKSRIVAALKRQGHTVGFLGDGINDAPALREADVGVSVDNAVDIAKESADVILLEKSLLVLAEGVAHGRHVFGNIMKYIKMTVSSNFGNVFSVLVASAVLPFPPMLPLHLLIQNLLYDISQISLPWDGVDEDYLERPRRWDPRSITRFTLYIGPVSSLFDFTTFALLWFVFGARTVEGQALFHSGWFVLGLLSQTLIVHMIRTRKIPFVQSTAARPVLVATTLVMLVGLALPFTPLGAAAGFVALPAAYFGWLLATLVAYALVVQGVKAWYLRRFDAWL